MIFGGEARAQLEVVHFEHEGRLMRCPDFGHDRKLRTCKRRNCPRCGIFWARDVGTRLTVNLGIVGRLAMLTITAPGEGRLPWDEAHCSGRHPYGGRHSGKRGCRCEQRAAREWAETAVYRWQLLRNAAQQATRRALKDELGLSRLPAGAALGVRVWEPQKRGVPHLHVVLGYETAHERRAAHLFVREVKRLAGEYDYGFSDARGRARKDDPRQGRVHERYGVEVREIDSADAARYLSSYLLGRKAHKSGIRENIANPVMPRALVWVSPKLTAVTGVTARAMRKARHLRAALLGRCESPRWRNTREAVEVVSVFLQVFRKRPPPLRLAEALVVADQVDERVAYRLGDDIEAKRTVWERYQPQLLPFAFELAERSFPVAVAA